MKKSKKISRIHTSRDFRCHQVDRANTRSLRSEEDLENLPLKESIRKAVWRADNDFGESTSFAGIASGEPRFRYFERMLKRNIGKSYDKFYSKMCDLFKGKDRIALDRFIEWEFTPHGYGGFMLQCNYSIKNGAIVKNK